MSPSETREEKTVQLNFKVSAADREALRAYFKRRGLPLATGLRMVVLDFMESKGISR